MGDYKNIFTKNPLVVMQIFQYLPTIDLVRSQRVCKFWKKYSEITIKKRSRKVAVEMLNIDCSIWDDNAATEISLNKLMDWRTKWNFIPSVFIFTEGVNYSFTNAVMRKFARKCIPKKSKFIYIRDQASITNEPNRNCVYSVLGLLDRKPFLSTNVVHLPSCYGIRKARKVRAQIREMLKDKETKFVLIMCKQFPNDVTRVMQEIDDAIKKGVVVMGLQMRKEPIVVSASEVRECDIVALSFGGSDVFAASVFMDRAWHEWVPLDMENLRATVAAFECADHDDSDKGRCKSCNSQLIGFNIPEYEKAEMKQVGQQNAFFDEFPKVPLVCVSNTVESSFGDEINLFGKKGGRAKNVFLNGENHRGGSMAGVVFLK